MTLDLGIAAVVVPRWTTTISADLTGHRAQVRRWRPFTDVHHGEHCH
jgi:hypothetical protein